MNAYQVIYWPSVIKPEARNMTNLCDGAVFRHEVDARAFALDMLYKGAKVLNVREIPSASHWFESVDEYNRAGLMTADELHAIGQRGATVNA